MVDYACTVLFPFLFATFNMVYWSLQYSRLYAQDKVLQEILEAKQKRF